MVGRARGNLNVATSSRGGGSGTSFQHSKECGDISEVHPNLQKIQDVSPIQKNPYTGQGDREMQGK